MCLATSQTESIELDEKGEPKSRLEQMKSIFFPMVKPELLDEFKTVWGKFFVLTNTIQDEKKPGLLKTEFTTSSGRIIALCPKNYQIYCNVKGKFLN